MSAEWNLSNFYRDPPRWPRPVSVEQVTCPDCDNGVVWVESTLPTADIARPCPRCEGTGSIPKEDNDGTP